MTAVTDDDLLRWRMHAHFESRPEVVEIARRVAGIQAQDGPATRLALRARGLRSAGALQDACLAGEVVSSWLMRGTQHLLPVEDLARWLGLFRERNLAATARRRRELGLTEQVCAAALATIPEVLTEPLSRARLVAALNERGVGVEVKGQAPAHLMLYAASHGLLCRGAEVAPREPGYVLLPPGPTVDPDDALGELARRYAGAYGPVGPADFAAWSGLQLGAGRRAFALAGLTELTSGRFVVPGAMPPPDEPPLVRLLGGYDTYLLGYRGRESMLDPAFTRRVNAGGGVIRPVLVADGRVLGTWRREGGELLVEPFGALPAAVRPGLRAEAEAVGRFLGERLTLRVG